MSSWSWPSPPTPDGSKCAIGTGSPDMCAPATSGGCRTVRIGIYGAGAWGTALAIAFAANHQVRLWGREAMLQEEMAASRRNARYLPGVELPPQLAVETDFATTAAD